MENKDKNFVFNSVNLKKSKEIINRYPATRQKSAILPLLDLAQRQNGGWLSVDAIEYVANMINLPHIKALEVASFYTMFNLKPVGKFHIQVCGTTPCWLRGAGDIISKCSSKLGISDKETTQDGMFTLTEVECLGACVNAPLVQINDDYYEDLTPEIMEEIIDQIIAGKKIKTGSQIGRKGSKALK
ncbi:MAG: NADH-quinone oxidoreductase subunit NuoE [Rickettsiaceae bacterium]|nr:NADH-quinone oxidoreductase subunit NuoE [Rickettsiaceae bacterium]